MGKVKRVAEYVLYCVLLSALLAGAAIAARAIAHSHSQSPQLQNHYSCKKIPTNIWVRVYNPDKTGSIAQFHAANGFFCSFSPDSSVGPATLQATTVDGRVVKFVNDEYMFFTVKPKTP